MSYIADLVEDFINILFPRICYACGNHLTRNENIICTECFVVIPRTNYHVDDQNPVAQLFWGRCMIEKAATFSFYNKGSRIRKLIHNLKYNGLTEIGYELGRIYALSLKSTGFTDDIDLIIPVPIHKSKMRVRGFNQSDFISSGISIVTGLPVENQVLTRIKASATQTNRTRYDRWTNVDGIFCVGDPEKILGKHILLVDDVITTGSTIESCTNELLKVNGVRVSVVALAFAVV